MEPNLGQQLALDEARNQAKQAREKLEVMKVQNLAKADAVVAMAKALSETARVYGVVVTMHTAPQHPPRMGQYDMRWEVRPSREMYQQEADLFQAYLTAHDRLEQLEKALKSGS